MKPKTRVPIKAADRLLPTVDRAVDRWANTQRAKSLLNFGISVDPSANNASFGRLTAIFLCTF